MTRNAASPLDHRFWGVVVLGALLITGAAAKAEQKVTKAWAVSEFGEPLYKDGFEHWPYANPDAPKGGKVVLGAFGSFDSLNPIILKGEWPRSIGLVLDSLMTSNGNELMSAYGLIAESVEYPEDKSWAIFNIRPEARFQDGEPITAHDFAFSWQVVQDHGRPFLKSFYADVEGVEVLSDHRLKFTFKTRDSMKPLMIVAGITPLPRHYWADKDVSRTTLEPPVWSGPYRIKSVEAGRSITYERVRDYWAADLPVNRGLNNFDEIRYEYYRDQTVQFEAFKAGEIDFRAENSVKRWKTGYDIPPVKSGDVVQRILPEENPRGIGAYFFNLRRPQFRDVRVRRAINYFYDFEAIQRTLLYGEYRRIRSYFPNSDYGVSGPPTAEELAVLEPFAGQLPPEVTSEAFEPPKTDGSGRMRANIRKALALFKQAGWVLKDGKLVDGETGERFTLEIITASPETQRLTMPFIENLKRAGIDASLRLVDTAQYEVRIDDFDFDMFSARLNFFPPPGPELRSYFGSGAAEIRGSANMMGIKSPVADALIEQIITAKDLATLKATNRALDRVLLWGFNLVPQYYPDEQWLAYWNKFGYPETHPKYSSGFPASWWIDQKLAQELAAR